MKRKASVILLALLLLLPLHAPAAEAESFGSGDYTWRLLEDGTAEILEYNGSESNLVIPGELEGHPISAIGNMAFVGKPDLLDLTLPEGIVTIGEDSFLECGNLERVTFPSSLRTIGLSAFSTCGNLKEVSFQEGLEHFGMSVFRDCVSLTEAMLPDSVTEMEFGVFYGCEALKTVHLPTGLTSLGRYLFADCASLTDVIIPDGITTIEDGVFYNCTSLTEIVIPDSVTVIGYGAFQECENLEMVILPAGPVDIQLEAFTNTAWQKMIDNSFPQSFDDAADYRSTSWTFPAGKTVYSSAPELFAMLPESIRTPDGSSADYRLIRNIRHEARSDYNGPANDTITEMYLCGRDGTAALLFSVMHEPPEFGQVKQGESLNGRMATYEEIWEEIRAFFTE